MLAREKIPEKNTIFPETPVDAEYKKNTYFFFQDTINTLKNCSASIERECSGALSTEKKDTVQKCFDATNAYR